MSAAVGPAPWPPGSAATSFGSAGVAAGSAAAHSFGLGGAFAPIAPPDILDLDAWMDRENWNLGRLSSRPLDDTQAAIRRLDLMIVQEETRGHTVQAVVVRSGDPYAVWEVIQVGPGYSEIHVPPDAWLKILRHFDGEWQKSGTSSVSYKGIPVTIAPF